MGVARKSGTHRRVNVMSVRLNDEEMADLTAIMGATHKRKSEILKEAFNLYLKQYTGQTR